MKKYLFELHYQNKDLTYNANYHQEMFECHADAMVRAREILKEGKRDVNAYSISVYCKHRCDWKLIVSYQ